MSLVHSREKTVRTGHLGWAGVLWLRPEERGERGQEECLIQESGCRRVPVGASGPQTAAVGSSLLPQCTRPCAEVPQMAAV